MALTQVEVNKAKAGNKPVTLSDGHGLLRVVQPSGSKLWRYKYQFQGRQKMMSLGAYSISFSEPSRLVFEPRKDQ